MKLGLNRLLLITLSIGLFTGCNRIETKEDALKCLDDFLANYSEKYDEVNNFRYELNYKMNNDEIETKNKTIIDYNLKNNVIYTYQSETDNPTYEIYTMYHNGTYYEVYENSKQYREFGVEEESYLKWDSDKQSKNVLIEDIKATLLKATLELKDIINGTFNEESTYSYNVIGNGKFEYSINKKYDHMITKEKYVIDDYLLMNYSITYEEENMAVEFSNNFEYKSSIKAPRIKNYTLETYNEFKGEPLSKVVGKNLIDDIFINDDSDNITSFEINGTIKGKVNNENNYSSQGKIKYVAEDNIAYILNEESSQKSEMYMIYDDKTSTTYLYDMVKKEYVKFTSDAYEIFENLLKNDFNYILQEIELLKKNDLTDIYYESINGNYELYSNRPGHLGAFIDEEKVDTKIYIDEYLLKYYEQKVKDDSNDYVRTITVNYEPSVFVLPSFEGFVEV